MHNYHVHYYQAAVTPPRNPSGSDGVVGAGGPPETKLTRESLESIASVRKSILSQKCLTQQKCRRISGTGTCFSLSNVINAIPRYTPPYFRLRRNKWGLCREWKKSKILENNYFLQAKITASPQNSPKQKGFVPKEEDLTLGWAGGSCLSSPLELCT